jgi:predicted nucleic acid-binding protein
VRRYLLLDSGPLGLVTQPRISPEVLAVNHWLLDCPTPRQKTSGLARLDAFVRIDSNRYLALTDEALRLAAELWAKARQQGRPTSPTLDLDIDVILAAQALTLGVEAEVIVVTTNPRNLRQFVDARLWSDV